MSGLSETYISSGHTPTTIDIVWESMNSGDPTTYYEEGGLRRITDGMNGLEAATVMYDNDTTLRLKIQKLESQLEAYKAYAAQLEDDDTVNIAIEHEVGTGTTAVMSQAAVTNVIETMQKQVDDSAFVMNPIPKEAVPLDNVKTADYAIQAREDLEGHNLAQMWQDVRDLEAIISGLTQNWIELVEWKESIFKGA